ncbi:MAG: transposase [Deltaproteobacteria bacterium]|nr:transposase [Deltaproteobacteria bacterium]
MLEESPQERVWAYNDRAHIENHLKEITCGFGMEKLPSGDFDGNALYFGIGVLTYTLFIEQKRFTMPEDWRAKIIKSIRWLLVEVAGKLIHHVRNLTLKIAAGMEKYRIYLEMRRRTYELLLE